MCALCPQRVLTFIRTLILLKKKKKPALSPVRLCLVELVLPHFGSKPFYDNTKVAQPPFEQDSVDSFAVHSFLISICKRFLSQSLTTDVTYC